MYRFRPRLIDALAGYDRQRALADIGAGITVGIVALPLAMAFAIASGLKPEQGLITAIVAGFLISALGGSNVQIGGPAGAFIVIVYGILQRYGLTNLLIATALSGVLLFALGALKLGALVRYIPVTIIIGFTNGIAVLIGLSQLKDLLGLSIDKMPADFFSQIAALTSHLDSFNPYAFAIGIACFGGLFLWPRLFSGATLPERMIESSSLKHVSRVPGPVVALVSMTLVAWWFALPVETIGSRFGGIPRTLPNLALPPFSWESAQQLLIPTITIALLGAIESLMCARIAVGCDLAGGHALAHSQRRCRSEGAGTLRAQGHRATRRRTLHVPRRARTQRCEVAASGPCDRGHLARQHRRAVRAGGRAGTVALPDPLAPGRSLHELRAVHGRGALRDGVPRSRANPGRPRAR